ncbi:MAG: WYL domain-containing protein, partial [SAR324 cluster bacterium]|nr:WYL domain-containing protein [SAR324 cluster bacterium]
IRYHPSQRLQKSAPAFEPNLIRLESDLFLDHLRGQNLMKFYQQTGEWDDLPFIDVDRLIRVRPDEDVVRELVQALKGKQVLRICYQSKHDEETRDISPHHLVFADHRYHVRAFCHVRQKYRDFVLTRILDVQQNSKLEWISAEQDEDWNQKVVLCFRPNPELPLSAQQAMTDDFRLKADGILKVETNAALAYYVRRELQKQDSEYNISRWMEVK